MLISREPHEKCAKKPERHSNYGVTDRTFSLLSICHYAYKTNDGNVSFSHPTDRLVNLPGLVFINIVIINVLCNDAVSTSNVAQRPVK
jgi:hypothetical protein